MKKITLLILLIMGPATAQLRLGMDVNRTRGNKSLSERREMTGTAYTVGYEQMLLFGIIGVGAEYNIATGEKESAETIGFGYGVAKIPVGIPMLRGIIKAGTTFGHSDKSMSGGTSYGYGLRIKPPVFPIGIEILQTDHSFERGGGEYSYQGHLNITATYSF